MHPQIMKFFLPAVLLMFAFQSLWSQDLPRHIVNGKIKLDHSIVEDIYIENLSTSKNTLTVEGGYFTINARAGDTLMFSAIHIIGKQIILGTAEMSQDLIFVPLQVMPNQLAEVKIYQYDHINAVSLGIIPAGQRQYTKAERKLKAGGDLDAQLGTNSSISTDAVLNWMTGKTASLKKELEVERKESMQEKIEKMFDGNYMVNRLQIPSEYVRGFIIFAAEQTVALPVFSSKNRTAAAFMIADLAVQYKKIIAGESQ